MINKYNQKGMSTLVGIMFVILVSVAGMVLIQNIYVDSGYQQESNMISQRVLAFSADANHFSANKRDCRALHNVSMVSSGLIPKGWEVDKNAGLSGIFGIKYKHGNVVISSNLSAAELPSAHIGATNGYKITLSDFPSKRIPRFISQLIGYFDYISVSNILIKGENGIDQANYNSILNNEVGVSNISLINWGC